MVSFKVFFENMTFSDKTEDVLDDVTDEKIGENQYKEFDVTFDDGARAYGKIKNGVAYIASIRAPRLDLTIPKRGTKTYQRVLKLLYSNGIKTIKISLQSNDSRKAIERLLANQILINPREMSGVSVDQFPTKFDINPNTLMLEYRHNMADGTPALSVNPNNGKNPNRIDKKHMATVGPYKAKNELVHRPGQLFIGDQLLAILAEYNLDFKDGEMAQIKSSPNAIHMFINNKGQMVGKIVQTKKAPLNS